MFRFFIIHKRCPMLSWECGRSARPDAHEAPAYLAALYVFIITFTSQIPNCLVITMQHAAFNPIRPRTVNTALN